MSTASKPPTARIHVCTMCLCMRTYRGQTLRRVVQRERTVRRERADRVVADHHHDASSGRGGVRVRHGMSRFVLGRACCTVHMSTTSARVQAWRASPHTTAGIAPRHVRSGHCVGSRGCRAEVFQRRASNRRFWRPGCLALADPQPCVLQRFLLSSILKSTGRAGAAVFTVERAHEVAKVGHVFLEKSVLMNFRESWPCCVVCIDRQVVQTVGRYNRGI